MSATLDPKAGAGRQKVAESESKDRLAALLEEIDLTPFQKELLRDRWLAQMSWMSRQAKRTRSRYYWVRLPVVIGGLLIPGLISFTFAAKAGQAIIPAIPWLDFEILRLFTFGVSLLVASLAAVEGLYHFGDRWRHYRQTAERLKSTGWQFLMLNGAFRRFESHEAAFVAFTERVEDVLGEEVEGYMGSVVAEGGERTRHDVVA